MDIQIVADVFLVAIESLRSVAAVPHLGVLIEMRRSTATPRRTREHLHPWFAREA
jgi:hypothetical protein